MFVTWNLRPIDANGNKVSNDAIQMRDSPDGGTNFQAPLFVNDDGYSSGGDYVFSETAFTPGRTGDSTSGGNMVTAMTHNQTPATGPTIRSDSLKFGGAVGVPQLESFTGQTGPITDAIDGSNPDIDFTSSTFFNIAVSGVNRIDSISLDLGISHQALGDLRVLLHAPNGATIELIRNRTQNDGSDPGDGRGLAGTFLDTSFVDSALVHD